MERLSQESQEGLRQFCKDMLDDQHALGMALLPAARGGRSTGVVPEREVRDGAIHRRGLAAQGPRAARERELEAQVRCTSRAPSRGGK